MYGGRIVADLPVAEASIERIGLLMAGGEERRKMGRGMIHLRLERRSRRRPGSACAAPVAASAATLILCSGLVALAGANVLDAYALLFLTPSRPASTSRDR